MPAIQWKTLEDMMKEHEEAVKAGTAPTLKPKKKVEEEWKKSPVKLITDIDLKTANKEILEVSKELYESMQELRDYINVMMRSMRESNTVRLNELCLLLGKVSSHPDDEEQYAIDNYTLNHMYEIDVVKAHAFKLNEIVNKDYYKYFEKKDNL